MEIETVNPNVAQDTKTGVPPRIFTLLQQTHVFDATLQKELLSKYKQNSKIKSQKYSKFLADKKASTTIIFGQCEEATKTKIALVATYTANRQAGRLIEFLNQLCTICFSNDNYGLSYAPYKQVMAVKLLNNFSNSKPHDTNGFKEEIKIKYDSVKAIAGRFPNETATIMVLLAAETITLD